MESVSLSTKRALRDRSDEGNRACRRRRAEAVLLEPPRSRVSPGLGGRHDNGGYPVADGHSELEQPGKQVVGSVDKMPLFRADQHKVPLEGSIGGWNGEDRVVVSKWLSAGLVTVKQALCRPGVPMSEGGFGGSKAGWSLLRARSTCNSYKPGQDWKVLGTLEYCCCTPQKSVSSPHFRKQLVHWV
jgi:hypothetical protein